MSHRVASLRSRRLLMSGAVFGALLGWPLGVEAANWPGWRGDGSGISTEKGLPVHWDAKTNILWKVAVPGEGNSSPIIWDGRIHLTSTLEGGKKRVVLCYDAADGREVWRREFAVETVLSTNPKNGYASHTPATDGQRVYAFFDEPGLVALDAKTGTVVWQLGLGPFKTGGYLAASPIVSGELLIMVCDVNESTYDGKKQSGGFMVGVDKVSGREVWRVARKSSAHSASPLAIEVGGRTQIVVSGEAVIGYDAKTGQEIWSCKGMKPVCAPSPVFDGSLVWVTSGRNGPAIVIDPTGSGDVSETHGTMLTDSGGPYVPSPLIYPFLMLPGDDGKMSFLDKSGRLVLRTRVPGHFSASPIGADGRIYWPDEKGRTYVMDAGTLTGKEPRASILAINNLGEPILASPAVSNGRLYLRSVSSLYCIAGSAKTEQSVAPPTIQGQATLAELQQRYEKFPADEGPDVAVRLEVVDAVAILDDPAVAGFLFSVMKKDPHWDVSEAGAKALGQRGADATDVLIQMLEDSREYSKVIAADALGERKAVKAAGKLAALTGDQNRFVRLAALRALGRIGQAEGADLLVILPALTKGLSDNVEGFVKIAAIQALAGLADKAGGQREKIVQGLQSRSADRNVRVAREATEALVKAYKAAPGATASPATQPATK